jgi:hypothetical protein
MVFADAHRQSGVASCDALAPTSNREVKEYLAVLDDAAFGGATPVEPKFISPTDPAARWTAASGGPAVYAYADNYLIDLKHAVIMDVEANTAVRQADVEATGPLGCRGRIPDVRPRQSARHRSTAPSWRRSTNSMTVGRARLIGSNEASGRRSSPRLSALR